MKRHIHLGLGKFHRAHQALYLQNSGYRITAFSMRSPRESSLLAQAGHRYRVTLCGGGETREAEVDAIDEALFVQESQERLWQLMEDSAVSTLTLTITEKGYASDSQTISFLVEGLRRRQARHREVFHLLSCDNLNGNGDLLAGLCQQKAADLSCEIDWSLVSFPNTMVDRIVPAADDPLNIRTEEFHQWVIEDNFQVERPSWEQEGLLFVNDLEPYEKIKLNLLNASHSFMAYYAQLKGHEFVHQAITDPEIKEKVCLLYYEEVGPLLEAPEGFDLESYGEALLARFNNPDLPHRLDQIAMDGSAKIPQRFLPFIDTSEVLQEALEAWFRYMWEGLGYGHPYRISDPQAEKLKNLADDDYRATRTRWRRALNW